jgi:hypothetical protein
MTSNLRRLHYLWSCYNAVKKCIILSPHPIRTLWRMPTEGYLSRCNRKHVTVNDRNAQPRTSVLVQVGRNDDRQLTRWIVSYPPISFSQTNAFRIGPLPIPASCQPLKYLSLIYLAWKTESALTCQITSQCTSKFRIARFSSCRSTYRSAVFPLEVEGRGRM